MRALLTGLLLIVTVTPAGAQIQSRGSFPVQLDLFLSGPAAAQSNVLQNQAQAEQFINNNNANVTKANLAQYTQVRMTVRVPTASASVNTPIIYLRYATALSSPPATTDFSNVIGATEVKVSLAAIGFFDTGWVNLVTGAKADVFLSVLSSGGDGAADPQVQELRAQFR